MSLFADAIASLRLSRDGRPRRDAYTWSAGTGRGSIDLVADLTASYAEIYHTQPWVHAAVNKLMRSVGMLPLKSYRRNDVGHRERRFDGPLVELMHRPFRAGTPSYWKQHFIGSCVLYGNAIFVKLGAESPTDVPVELFPAPAYGWSVGENDTYVWRSDKGEFFAFPRWQIMHFRHWNTSEDGFGVSALEPLRRTLAIEDAASRLGVAAFKNGIRPASVVQTDQTLTEPVIKRLRANIENLYGSVDKAFRLAILEQGLDWKPLSHNLNDSAVVEHRKLTREEVAAVIDIPQPSIGILDEANFASITALHLMYYQDSLGPWLRMGEETIQAELLDLIPSFDNHFVEFDLGMVLRGDINTRSVAYQRFITSGVYTQNEVRSLENLPPKDDPAADRLHLPLNLGPDPAVGQSNPDNKN